MVIGALHITAAACAIHIRDPTCWHLHVQNADHTSQRPFKSLHRCKIRLHNADGNALAWEAHDAEGKASVMVPVQFFGCKRIAARVACSWCLRRISDHESL